MKKILLLPVILFLVSFPLYGFAQNAKIINLRGKVTVKLKEAEPWKKAKVNMILENNAEVETKENSNCTLAFDDAHKNIITMKSNSRLKLDSIKPADISLKEGRVFTLIESLSKNEKFQVRTPTAIAGARGTGWATDFHDNKTSVLCFEDTVYVNGLDNSGNLTGEKDVPEGSGLEIGAGGVLGGLFNLDNVDFDEWDDFTGHLEDIANNNLSYDENEGDALDEARQEQKEDFGELAGENRRQEAGTERSTVRPPSESDHKH